MPEGFAESEIATCNMQQGVVVPEGFAESEIAAVMRAAFSGGQFSVEQQDGMVYVVPDLNRLHLDLYPLFFGRLRLCSHHFSSS